MLELASQRELSGRTLQEAWGVCVPTAITSVSIQHAPVKCTLEA